MKKYSNSNIERERERERTWLKKVGAFFWNLNLNKLRNNNDTPFFKD